MRILVASRAYFPAVRYGGPVTWLRTIFGELASRGHDVQVVCSDMASDSRRAERVGLSEGDVDGVSVRYFRTQLRYRWEGVCFEALAEVPELVRHSDAVLIAGTRHFLGTVVMSAARRSGIPYVVSLEGSIPARSHNTVAKHVIDRGLTSHELSRARFLVVMSDLEARELASWGADDSRIRVAPPWAPALEFVPSPRAALRREMGLPVDATVLLWVGRIHSIKGLPLLLEALADPRLANVLLLLAGDGTDNQLSSRLRERASQPDLAGRVSFLGWVDTRRRSELFVAADLFVFPSLHENFGLAVAEALRGGLPVVISSRCGTASMVDGHAGLVCEPQVGALADALHAAVNDPEEHARLRLGARRLGSELDPARCAAWLERLLVSASADIGQRNRSMRSLP